MIPAESQKIPMESLLRGKRILETKFSFLFIDCQPVGAYREVSLRVSMHDSKSKNVLFTLHTMYVAQKNEKIMLMSGSKEAKKEKRTKKKTIRIRRKHFQTGNHVATNIWHPTC